MAKRDTLLDEAGLRPGFATCAAVLGTMVGVGTLIGGVLLAAILVESAGTGPFVLLASLLLVTQVAAAALLVAGGVRLAIGAGRGALVAGAALELLVCAVYLLHALTVVAPDPDESHGIAVAFAIIPILVATASVLSLVLALRPTTTEYLLFASGIGKG